ncbi:MAG: glycogen/starch/alpha-glucan phosphorylase, partial [Myxococcales bacterium]|nr:glycogen/starch/alpha-glucan phosphorylase [Myxococcales bacterium]
RYEFGIFDQVIKNGWQVERTDAWLHLGNPWEVRRWDVEYSVGFGGRTEHVRDASGALRARWVPERTVRGIPHDTPVLGYGVNNANFLRLWTAAAPKEFDLDAFQVGEYWRAVDDKVRSENISKVLYPNDHSEAGKQLRLEQQNFFVSCALQDCIRLLLQRTTIERFPEKFAVQLNDTHPSLAVPELMRLFMDVHGLGWDEAWDLTTRSIAYTNHTLLPEALETWPLPLFARLLPRHLEIVYEINRRFLDELRERYPGDEARVARMSLIDEHGEKRVRMAHLAAVASHRVNGVAELHSRLLTETVMRDFAEVFPDRFTNVTNGVTPRRFVALANRGLSALLDEVAGPGWLRDLEKLRALEAVADDPAFQERWRGVKLANKRAFARWLDRKTGTHVDADTLFDVQCKRIHEYKRQHLNVLHVVWLWDRLVRGLEPDAAPRTFLIAGKAAPAYHAAKLMIRLATAVGTTLERDAATRDRIRLVFVPDFNVKNAQHLYPAADLSEQISTAGKEASGTGNMKLSLNGALTIGTLDGANVEIREAVGADEFFLFGMTTEEVEERRRGGYDPRRVIDEDHELGRVLSLLTDGTFAPEEPGVFAPLVRHLVEQDPFFVLADFRAYVEAQRAVSARWHDPTAWTRSSILNVARMGRFSSDRSIRDYLERVWHAPPVEIQMP